MTDKFVNWLYKELEDRGWSRMEAARRGGVSASMFDKVMNGHANPGLEFCIGVARAFSVPPEYVMRLAGIIPGSYALESGDELQDILRGLPKTERQDILEYARFRYRLFRERREGYHTNPGESDA